MADGWNNVSEADDLNNNNASSSVTTITGLPCPMQTTPPQVATSEKLRQKQMTWSRLYQRYYWLCRSGDKGDLYKLSMGRAQNITVVMTADNWDADLDLRLWNTTLVLQRLEQLTTVQVFTSNESVSTSGTNADGAADTYFINVSHYLD